MQRYFDGTKWGQFASPLNPPPPPKKARSPKKILAVIGAIVFLIIVGKACGSDEKNGGSTSPSSSPPSSARRGTTSTTPTYTEREIEAAVIDTCKKAIKQDLKDPDSAKFGDDWKAWIVTQPPTQQNVPYHPESGDKLYSAGGTVNAKNSFGGYVGYQMYGCDASITTSGDIHAHGYSLNDILNPTETP
ncbi:hypothetical protein A5682_08920 [Mycobacterium mantenii]|nr:hypothetical protein A5682_08920 [Mycobacterium mantenii]